MPRKRVLNVVCNPQGGPFAVCDSEVGLDAEILYLSANEDVTWQFDGIKDIEIEFEAYQGAPFSGWTSRKKKGKSVDGKVGTGKAGVYKYTVRVDGSSDELDPAIIIER
jgi:hypothetical protein